MWCLRKPQVFFTTLHLLSARQMDAPTGRGSPEFGLPWAGKHSLLGDLHRQNACYECPGSGSVPYGRLESKIMLTPIVGTSPTPGVILPENAAIIFGYVDSSHYRYVRVQSNRIMISQVGDYEGEVAGIKASMNVGFKINQWNQIRVDVYATGGVHVYANPPISGTAPKPLLGYAFATAVSGRAGYLSSKAKSLYDDFTAWDATVLPQEPVLIP